VVQELDCSHTEEFITDEIRRIDNSVHILRDVQLWNIDFKLVIVITCNGYKSCILRDVQLWHIDIKLVIRRVRRSDPWFDEVSCSLTRMSTTGKSSLSICS